MRLATIDRNGRPTPAVRKGNDYVDLTQAAPALPKDIIALIGALGEVRGAIEEAAENASGAAIVPGEQVRFFPLVPRPGKMICLGLNYVDHAAEGGHKPPEYPAIFLRGPSSLTAHKQPIIRPQCSVQLDYEAELAVIIGKTARHLTKDNALDCVAGYACFNEGSVREYQRKTPQWTIGKNFDQTGGFGPDLVTPDELPAGAKGLKIMSRLNGKVMQDGNTADMIFDVPTTLVTLSECMTLEPGDVIVMGTPAGVGHAKKPGPVWMKAGDTIEIEIEGIGTLVNPIEDEAA